MFKVCNSCNTAREKAVDPCPKCGERQWTHSDTRPVDWTAATDDEVRVALLNLDTQTPNQRTAIQLEAMRRGLLQCVYTVGKTDINFKIPFAVVYNLVLKWLFATLIVGGILSLLVLLIVMLIRINTGQAFPNDPYIYPN